MFSDYNLALFGIWLLLFTMLLQGIIAAIAHRKQSVYVPGIVDDQLNHESFVFRSHRTWMNSIENSIPMLGMTFLAIFLEANPPWVAAIILVYALARIIHMLLYYFIATRKNPSPRSYFFIIGLASNIAMAVLTGMAFF